MSIRNLLDVSELIKEQYIPDPYPYPYPLPNNINTNFTNYVIMDGSGEIPNDVPIIYLKKGDYTWNTDLSYFGFIQTVLYIDDDILVPNPIISNDISRNFFNSTATQPVSGAVTALLVSPYEQNKILLGGSFTSVQNLNQSCFAVYDLSASTFTNEIHTFVGSSVTINVFERGDNNNVFCGGNNYTSTDGSSFCSRMFILNTTNNSISALGQGTTTGNVNACAYDGSGYYVAGTFTSVIQTNGTTVTSRVARWDIASQSWSACNTGVAATVSVLCWDSVANLLYIGCQSSPRLIRYNRTTNTGTAFSPIANGSVFSIAINNDNGNVYVAGSFTDASSNYVRLLYFNRSDFISYSVNIIPELIASSNSVVVDKIFMDYNKERIYVSGNFPCVNYDETSILSGGTTLGGYSNGLRNIIQLDFSNNIYPFFTNASIIRAMVPIYGFPKEYWAIGGDSGMLLNKIQYFNIIDVNAYARITFPNNVYSNGYTYKEIVFTDKTGVQITQSKNKLIIADFNTAIIRYGPMDMNKY